MVKIQLKNKAPLLNKYLCAESPTSTVVAVLWVSLKLNEVEMLKYCKSGYPLFLGRQIGIREDLLNLFPWKEDISYIIYENGI